MKKKTNVWVILAILIIGVPVGYVVMGVLDRSAAKDLPVVKEDSIKVQQRAAAEKNLSAADSIGVPAQVEPEAEQPTSGSDDMADSPVPVSPVPVSPVPVPQKPDRNVEQRQVVVVPSQPKTAEQLREMAERAEEKRLQQEKQAQMKKEEEKRRSEQAKKAEEERRAELKSEIEVIFKNRQCDRKVPEDCSVDINDGERVIDYQNYRSKLGRSSYSDVKVIYVDIDYDKKIAKRIKVKAKVNQSVD